MLPAYTSGSMDTCSLLLICSSRVKGPQASKTRYLTSWSKEHAYRSCFARREIRDDRQYLPYLAIPTASLHTKGAFQASMLWSLSAEGLSTSPYLRRKDRKSTLRPKVAPIGIEPIVIFTTFYNLKVPFRCATRMLSGKPSALRRIIQPSLASE